MLRCSSLVPIVETESPFCAVNKHAPIGCCSSLVPIVETESVVERCNDFDKGRCSSLVPIVETESYIPLPPKCNWRKVAVHSFRLWKLKDHSPSRTTALSFRCSSLVPIVETERQAAQGTTGQAARLQFTRSDCGN